MAIIVDNSNRPVTIATNRKPTAAQQNRAAKQVSSRRSGSGYQVTFPRGSSASGPTYSVVSGNTLSSIARSMGTTVADIMKANPSIRDPNKISIGQQIVNPVAKAAAARQNATAAADKAAQLKLAAKTSARTAAPRKFSAAALQNATAASDKAQQLKLAAKTSKKTAAVRKAAQQAPVKAVAKAAPAPVKVVAKAAPAPAPVKAVAKTPAKVVAPATKTTTTTGSGTAAQSHNLSGSGTFGRFNRKRLNRGPISGLSMTPEMLASAARQRIVNYH